MDVNHRRINNLSNVFIAAAFAFFLPFFLPKQFRPTIHVDKLFFPDCDGATRENYLLQFVCRSSKLQIHLKTIWIRMQHQIE